MFKTLAVRSFSSTLKRNARVSLIGASNTAGVNLALLLKQNPYITELKLYDDEKDLKGMAMDLSHIDSKAKVQCYQGFDNFRKAMSYTDIAVINNIEGGSSEDSSNLVDISKKVDKMVIELHHTNEVPIIVVMSQPVTAVTALFGRFLFLEKLFDTKRLMGITSSRCVVANKKFASTYGIPPEEVNWHLYGGTVPDTMYFWKDKLFPEEKMTSYDNMASVVSSKVCEFLKLQDKLGNAGVLDAYSAHRFISNLAESFQRRRMVVESAVVCHERFYMSLPVVLGKEGVEQIILNNEVETPNYYDTLAEYVTHLEKFDDVLGILDPNAIVRPDDPLIHK